MAIWVAMLAAAVELMVAASVYISVAAPERAPLRVAEAPLGWRLGLLFVLSIVCGATLQLAGVIHRSH